MCRYLQRQRQRQTDRERVSKKDTHTHTRTHTHTQTHTNTHAYKTRTLAHTQFCELCWCIGVRLRIYVPSRLIHPSDTHSCLYACVCARSCSDLRVCQGWGIGALRNLSFGTVSNVDYIVEKGYIQPRTHTHNHLAASARERACATYDVICAHRLTGVTHDFRNRVI